MEDIDYDLMKDNNIIAEQRFDKLKELFYELYQIEEYIMYHECVDDSIKAGCDCGCGGDSIDWEESAKDYEESKQKQTAIESQIMRLL